ncbi:MAG TPA: hypothetical protein VKA37_08875, partial [Halobacteriales archaeon]|nr:hypothetical protein [Halobacteriales archaeon]
MSVAYALVVASITGVPLALGPGTAGAANHAASGPYAVGQYVPNATDGPAFTCVDVEPLGDRTLNGSEYYDYGRSFSSMGTIDLQDPFLSQFYVYDGSDGTSLLFLHSKVTNTTGATGGAVTFDVTGLPTDGEWTVEDDNYSALGYDPENQSDSFVHEGSHSRLKWRYSHNRTDGAVFRGLGSDGWTEITIDPAFREEALGPDEDWIHADEGPNEWVVRSRDGNTTALDMDEPVSIRQGPCGSVAPSAALSAPAEATAESDVTLNATNPASPTSPVR